MGDPTLFAAVVVFIGLVATGGIFSVYAANRAIGAHYDALARRLRPLLEAEGIRHMEADVPMRARFVAFLAVAWRSRQVDLIVTARALYVVQHRRVFGRRLGQPILAAPLRGPLDPSCRPLVTEIRLDEPPRTDGGALVLRGRLGRQSASLALRVASPEVVAQRCRG